MDGDGHSGLSNKEVNKGNSGDFHLVLSFLKDSSGRGFFVIHATSNVLYGPRPHPLQFLEQIGFSHFAGDCIFNHDRCFYRYFAEIQYDDVGFEDIRQNMYIHEAFSRFAKDGISRLYELQRQQHDLLAEIKASGGELDLFGPVPKIKPDTSEGPSWIEAIKFKGLVDLEKQNIQISKNIADLKEYLPLVYADGAALETAVIKTLRLLSLKAEATPPGFTADILAETKDGVRRFGFEVTGTTEAIKKESKKLTQLLDFERIKEHNEKTILVANTFKNVTISEREKRESFTPQVVDFLRGFPILLMTGWDLYRIVEEILERKKPADYYVDRMYNEKGVFLF